MIVAALSGSLPSLPVQAVLPCKRRSILAFFHRTRHVSTAICLFGSGWPAATMRYEMENISVPSGIAGFYGAVPDPRTLRH